MNVDFLKNLTAFLVLLLVQVLVLGHIHIFDCATPMLFVYFGLRMRRGRQRWEILLWNFALGLAIDMFTNTPGVGAASMTLVGFVQPYLLELFLSRDAAEDLLPSIATLGIGKYVVYSLILTVLFCLCYFSLEAFNFYNWVPWLASVSGSTIITYILVLVVDNLRQNR